MRQSNQKLKRLEQKRRDAQPVTYAVRISWTDDELNTAKLDAQHNRDSIVIALDWGD